MQASDDPHEVLCDVILVISCGYEDDTEWGRSVSIFVEYVLNE